MKENLNSYTVVELRKLVRDHGGKRIYGINKAQLVSSLRELLEQEDQALNSIAVDRTDVDDGKCIGATPDTSDCADLVTTANSVGRKKCSNERSKEQGAQTENPQSAQIEPLPVTTKSPEVIATHRSASRRSVGERQNFSGILEVNQEGFGFA